MRVKFKSQGYTLVEILIIIFLIGIFSSFFLSALFDMYKHENRVRYLLKSDSDIKAFKTYLRRELELIGFGVPKGICSFWGFSPLDLSNNQSYLRYYTLAARGNKWSGCWYVYDNNIFRTTATNRFGEPCPFPNDTRVMNHYFIAFGSDKRCENLNTCLVQGSQVNKITLFTPYYLVYVDDSSNINPTNFCSKILTVLYLNNSSLIEDKICHPLLRRSHLSMIMGNDTTSQPILSCVADLRMSCLDKNSNTIPCGGNQIPTFLKVCMIVQVGSRQAFAQEKPKYSSLCSAPTDNNGTPAIVDDLFAIDPNYRFTTIEEIIPLYNLQGLNLP